MPELSLSSARGVAQEVNFACDGSIACIFAPGLPEASSLADGVSHDANCATVASEGEPVPGRSKIAKSGPAALAFGLGHPIKPVSDVRRTDARSRERDRPDGVTQSFQVILNKVDPRVCVLARNLLSKYNCRAALLDEPEPRRP
jgi:hypothetical protein